MLIPELGLGGAQGSFLRLARFLAGQAHVTVAVMQGDVSEAADLTVYRLDEGGGGKARRWWSMLRRLRALKRRHDVTISFLAGMNLLNALAGERARTIVSERGSKRHDIGMTTRQRLIWTRILDPLTYWRAGRVVAASEGLAHEVITANPWVAPRVVAIEVTVEARALVDAADLQIEPDLQQLAAYETIIAFGRLHVQKGFDVLLAAFAIIRAERPAARLLLIGAGPEEASLRALAAELRLSVGDAGSVADVILPGMRPNPSRYMQLGRVFVLPSRYEGLPNALIESLAAGIPILASDCFWGPRSILSAGSLPYGGTEPAMPLVLAHGVLMPLPDAPGAVWVWAQEIAHALASPPPPRPDAAARLAAVVRYDIGRTGPRWLEIVKDMALQAGPR